MNWIKKIFSPIDLTKGTPWKKILLFAIPILLETILNNAFGLINALILKTTVGGDSVTAMNATGTISAILFNFAYGCTGGFAIIAANKAGAKDQAGIKKTFYMSLFLSVCLAVLITTVGLIFYKEMLEFLNISDQYLEKSEQYYQIVLISFIFILINNMLSNFVNAMGNSSIPLVISISGTLVHILLGFLLTGVATLDTRGVAIASLCANAFDILLYLLYLDKKYRFLRPDREAFRLDGKLIGSLLALGLPLGFQWSILFIGSFYQARRVNQFGGGLATKATGCYGSFESYLTIPLSVIASALGQYVGQNYGARDKARIKAGIRDAFLIDLISYVGILIVGYFTAPYVPYIFLPASEVDDPESGPRIVYYTATYLRVISPFLICQGIVQLSRNSIEGIKKPLIPFLSGVGELFARILVCYLIPAQINPDNPLSDESYLGICFSTPIAWVVSVLVMGGSLLYLVYFKNLSVMDREMKKPELSAPAAKTDETARK
jgi:Na+-driven multidrug efflux pump